MKNLITHVIDCGKCNSTIFDVKADETRTITHQEVLNLPETLAPGSFVVSEAAHLGSPRGAKSLAQPFTKDQLLGLYERFDLNGITLRLFPQKLTPRALGTLNEAVKGATSMDDEVDTTAVGRWLESLEVDDRGNLIKNDLVDPRAVYHSCQVYPGLAASLMVPRNEFHTEDSPVDFLANVFKFKDHTNWLCNYARASNPKYDDPISNWIKDNIDYIAANLSKEAKDVFNIIEYKNHKTGINLRELKTAQLFSIACTIMDMELDSTEVYDRIRPETGEMPGWSYVKRYILCMTPFHMRGGTARSTLYYHGLKSWVSGKINEDLDTKTTKKRCRGGMLNTDRTKDGKEPFSPEQEKLFIHYRKVYCDAIREVWRLFRDMRTNGFSSGQGKLFE